MISFPRSIFDADRVATDILGGSGEGLPILSEELSPETDDCEQRMWVVDPLDGTTAYLMGAGPEFFVGIDFFV